MAGAGPGGGDALRLEPLQGHAKYEKIRDLDKGAFGWVQHARNRHTGEEVAIKFITLGPRFYHKYVMREILNHRQLAHPHVVAFKEVFITQQYLGIVMEFVGGGNLQQYVEAAGRLPEWQARCFFQQLILALQYCHQALNIAHRDIKLGNVLLNTKYQIPILKVCDFGYSKNMMDSAPKTRVGTAAYISPEVARSPGNLPYDTEKADVWSCGVTLYCMLTGRYPFLSKDNTITLETIQRLSPADVAVACSHLRGVTPECAALLRAIFEIDPARRIDLAGIMANPWFRQGEEEITAILTEAERLSKLRQAQQAGDEFEMEGVSELVEDAYAELDQ